MPKRLYSILLLSVVCMLLAVGWGLESQAVKPGSSGSQFQVALIGDLPYDADQEAKFPNLIADINQAPVAFVIHDGDLKSGSTPCSDQLFLQRRGLFQSFSAPFIFVFGDNEWTDCHRSAAGGYDPIERLAALRKLFTEGNQSLGKRTLTLSRQSDNARYRPFRENVRWSYGDVLFVALNMPGSNNNFGRSPSADAEYAQRNAANLAWLKDSFALATRTDRKGILLVIQANPGFERKPDDPDRTGYNDFLAALEAETLAFGKPVVLVHGDTHYFRIDKPLLDSKNQQRIEHFTRVETFGSPDVHWVLATIDPTDPALFRFEPKIVEKNRARHKL